MTNNITILDQLTKLNEQLIGLPSGVAVFFGVMIASFLLRWWHLFPNRFVSPVCTIGGMTVFCLLAPYAQEHMRIWLTKNALFGFIISALGSVIILKFGEHIPYIGRWLKVSSDTTFTKNPNPPDPDSGD